MSAVTNIFRRGAIYYFRRRLRWPDGAVCAICLSLRTARLAQARHVATLLSATCERAGADRNGTMAGISVSHRQRDQLFQRQLQAERDMLCEWRTAILLSHEDGTALEQGDPPSYCLDYFLEIMDAILAVWIENGLMDLRKHATLHRYFAMRFGAQLDAEACAALEAELHSPDILLWVLNDCAAQALSTVGAPDTPLNRALILQDLWTAKQISIQEERTRLTAAELNPRLPSLRGPGPFASEDPIGIDPHQPFRHLVRSYGGAYPLIDAHSPQPDPIAAPPPALPALQGWDAMTIVQFCALFLGECPRVKRANSGQDHLETGIEKDTQHQYEVAAAWLFQIYRGPMRGLQPAHIAAMVDQMDCTDGARYRKSSKQRALATVASGSGASGRGLSPATINRHLRNLRQMLAYYRRHYPLAEIHFEDYIRKDKRNARAKRAATPNHTLRAMFRLPIWTRSKSEWDRKTPGRIITHDSLYWGPILISYMLIRRAEFCQAMVASIEYHEILFQREKLSWPHLSIRDTPLGRVKNESAVRLLPLHPELIRLGFLDYVAAIEAQGHVALFPELTGKRVKPADIWGKRIGYVLHDLLPELERGQLAHSTRHTGTDILYNKTGVVIGHVSDLLGHTHADQTQGRYAKGAHLAHLRRAIEKMPRYTCYLEPAPMRLRQEVIRLTLDAKKKPVTAGRRCLD